MRKGWIALLVVALTVALAVPAMADVALNGLIRIKPYMNTYGSGAGYLQPTPKAVSQKTSAFIDERARLRFQVGDENVKGVAFFEFDQMWGDSAYSNGRNLGGGLEADYNNLETKNLFIWFKLPNTSIDVTAGVQNQSDSFAGIFMGGADLAGVFVNGKFEPVNWRFGYGKLWENNVANADDIDLWLVEGKLAPTKEFKIGLDFYFLNDRGHGVKGPTNAGGTGANGAAATAAPELAGPYDSLKIYMPGVDVAFNLTPAVTLSAFGFYQFGTVKRTGGTDTDLSGFALDVRGDINIEATGGKLFIEGLYVSGDKNPADDKYKSVVTLNNYNLSAAYYSRTDMFLLFPNIDDIQFTNKNLAYDSSNGGNGLWFIGGGYSQKLVEKLTGKIGLGYLSAVEKRARNISGGDAYDFANKSGMGAEVNAVLTYNIAKGLDFGVGGAYVFLGDAFKTPAGGDTAHDPWETHGRLNYAF